MNLLGIHNSNFMKNTAMARNLTYPKVTFSHDNEKTNWDELIKMLKALALKMNNMQENIRKSQGVLK